MERKSSAVIKDSVSDEIVEMAEKLVSEQGVKTLNVRMLMNEMGKSTRVFYNRFRNIEEVLNIVYEKVVVKMRDNLKNALKNSEKSDYFTYAENLIVLCMEDTYDLKNRFSQYAFEHDSVSAKNYEWWIEKIKTIINYGISNGYVKEDLDVDASAYFLWCLCRGCNADAVMRRVSKEYAVHSLKTGFACFIEGVKKTNS